MSLGHASSGLGDEVDTNIILQETIERVYVGDCYSDKYLGLFFIRGDNVVILGEIDPEKEVKEKQLTKVSWEEIQKALQLEKEKRDEEEQLKRRVMAESGLTIDSILNIDDF
eukprot:gene3709-4621_t